MTQKPPGDDDQDAQKQKTNTQMNDSKFIYTYKAWASADVPEATIERTVRKHLQDCTFQPIYKLIINNERLLIDGEAYNHYPHRLQIPETTY